MDKQRDILIERLEQKVKDRDQTIAEMAKSSPAVPVSEDRIAALETTVNELKGSVAGMIERLEQKVKDMDQTITEMAKSSPVAEDRIAALETAVNELKGSVAGILDGLLYQRSLIDEMQQKDVSEPEEAKKEKVGGGIESTEYIIAENTPELHPRRGRAGDDIVVC